MPFALTRLLKIFYGTGAPALVIVSIQNEFAGFLLREKLDEYLVDLDRARSEVERIPEALLSRPPFSKAFITSISSLSDLPAVAMDGRESGFWSQTELLRALSEMQKAPPDPNIAAQALVPAENYDTFLSKQLLASFPYPMFAASLQGKTLFFNQAFDEQILDSKLFKKSMRLMEEYFLELTRDLLVKTIPEKPPYLQNITAFIAELGCRLDICNLEERDRITGYLYLFRPLSLQSVLGDIDLLYKKSGLGPRLDDLEAHMLLRALEEHEHNVSHAASALKIRRSTLQNKMKRLKLTEKYGYSTTGPVPRKKKETPGTAGPEVRLKADVPQRAKKTKTINSKSAARSSPKAARSGQKRSASHSRAGKGKSKK